MHELSICQRIVDAVAAEMDKLPAGHGRLLKASVVVGGLRQIVPEYLSDAYAILAKDTVAEASSLEITTVPISGKCEECGWQGQMEKTNFACGSCGSARAEIVGGMELYLDSLEIEEEA